jgi:hypothetical protein
MVRANFLQIGAHCALAQRDPTDVENQRISQGSIPRVVPHGLNERPSEPPLRPP